MTTRNDRVVRAGTEWGLVLPPGWASISTDPDRRRPDIKRAVDRQFRGSARDELVRVRIQVEQMLDRDVRKAADAGAGAVHALVDPVAGIPVSATLLITEMTVGANGDDDSTLIDVIGSSDGVTEVTTTSVAGNPALRRVRRRLAEIEEGVGPEFWHTHLDILVEASPGELVVMSFATLTEPLVAQLLHVFDAIAGTLHRVGSRPDLAWEPSFPPRADTATG